MALDGFTNIEKLEAREAEKCILGGLLIDNSLMSQTRDLTVLDFTAKFHRAVFSAMLELAEENNPLDPVMIFEIFKRENYHESESWGISSITNLTFGLPHFSSIRNYIGIVKETSVRRKVISQTENLTRDLAEKKITIKQFCTSLAAIESELRTDAPNETDSFQPLSKVFGNEVLPVLDSYFKAETSDVLVSTGFPKIDNAIGGGLYPSDFLAIVAPPKSAKSALALQIGLNQAKLGKKVALLSLEMSNLQNCLRMIAQESFSRSRRETGTKEAAVAANWIRPGMSDKTYERASRIASSLFFDNFFVCQKPLSWKELKTEVRRLKKEQGLEVLIVDYWQLVRNENAKKTRAESLAEIAQGLKQLGQELNIVVISLGQFNLEGLKKRKAGEELSTLYLEGSGELLKSANIVLTVDIMEGDIERPDKPRFGTLTFKPLRSGADAKLECLFFGQFLTVEVI